MKKEEPITTSNFGDSADGAIKDGVVYVSWTSQDGSDYAYLYILANRKLYWINENYNEAEPVSSSDMEEWLEGCKNGDYEEWERGETFDSFDSIEEFLAAVGDAKFEEVEEEASEYPEYLSNDSRYTITLFVGDKKICEKIIEHR